MTKEAVIFDLFGTLVRGFPDELLQRSLAQMAFAVGVDNNALSQLWIEENGFKRHTGAFGSIAKEVQFICQKCNATPTPEQIDKAVRIRYNFTRTTLFPRSDAVHTLQFLSATGIVRGLISDCSPDVPDLWPETPFSEFIAKPVFSCSVGMKKPDPDIYMLACRELGVHPERCLYVGDGLSQELSGARSVGMHAILLVAEDNITPPSGKWEGHDWDGDRISTLSDVIRFLK